MQVNEQGLANKKQWEDKGYSLPGFDRAAVSEKTRQNPFWVHFGAGNIFRAFQAKVVQDLLNEGVLDRGLVVAEGFDYEIIEKMNHPHDDYNILVTLKADGSVEKTIVGSVVESLTVDSENDADFTRLREIFQKDSLQIASFTITEKGYSLVNGKGELLPSVADDMKNGPEKPQSYIGKVVSLLYTRFQSGEKPIAMVSMDNCSNNGSKLFDAVHTFAAKWSETGLTAASFVEYIENPAKVSFPWSMIDKITPRPDPSVEELLKKDGVEELDPVVTSKNTYVAPFVNAEECQYLVIEDVFPNGRPQLERGGLIFTTRETVDKVEKMKVCTCLNPLHTALAIFGCLLGYDLISKEMQDVTLKKLVKEIGYTEGLPVVINPGILDPKEFIDTVLNVRIPNSFMPDTPQRIATDTSQKLPVRYGGTLRRYRERSLPMVQLRYIPLVFAGWCRYLLGVDDAGKTMPVSPDPLLPQLQPLLADVTLGKPDTFTHQLRPILQNADIFGVDLYEAGLAKTVEDDFRAMLAGPGAVRDILRRQLSERVRSDQP